METHPLDAALLGPIEAVGAKRTEALCAALDATREQLGTLLTLDDLHRHGHEAARLEQALGPFGQATVNVAALSTVLRQRPASPPLAEDRRSRLHALRERLAELRTEWETSAARPPVGSLDDDVAAVGQWAETCLNRFAALCAALRRAQLELHGRYDPAVHDAHFAAFDWRQLSPREWREGPPVVVVASLDGAVDARLRDLVTLLESGLPLKLVALRTRLGEVPAEAVEAPRETVRLVLETLPLALQGVCLRQLTAAAPDLPGQLEAALASPRPVVLSLLCAAPGEDGGAFAARAARAVRSRAFPTVSYDPDRAAGFVACFDLGGNPAPAARWVNAALELPPAADRPAGSPAPEEAYTFARYALEDPAFADAFSDPPPDVEAETLVPLVDFLELSPAEQRGHLPIVRIVDTEGRLRARVVAPALARATAAQAERWILLQELAGLANPHLEAQRRVLEADFAAAWQEREAELRREVEAACEERSQRSFAVAVRQLVTELTGIDPGAEISPVPGRGPA